MSIVENLKEIVSLVQKIDNIELLKNILSLQVEIQRQFEENVGLRQQVVELKEELRVKDSLRFDNGEYYLRKEGSSEDGPFCSTCWDVDRKLVRMVRGGMTDSFYCQYCVNVRRKK